MASSKRKKSRKRTIPLVSAGVALVGSGIYALKRRKNGKAEA